MRKATLKAPATLVDHDKLDAISFWLVYNSNISVNDALAQAYTLGSKDKYQNAALLLRSNILQALSAVDKTMEETFMRFAKSSGGFAGLYSQFGAYQRWCRTTSTRAQFHEKTLEMACLLDDPDCPRAGRHRELEKAEIKKSEKAVQRVITAVRNFTNPFTIPDKDRLYSLASGSPTSKDVERDVLEADAVGKAAKADFITRLQSGHQGSFFDPIKRKKLKTMEACNKKIKLTSSQGKVIQYQEQSNVAFLLLVKSQCLDEPIDLDELMKYSLMPVPPSIGTSDGFFAKTNKATILHYLMEEFNQDELPYPKDALFIQDGMALLHVLSNLPPTCGEICLQILDQMIAKKHFLFSTDSYFPGSIKAQERLRRGTRYSTESTPQGEPLEALHLAPEI
ncbi:uncharacterized protein [Palaemon carinicauda]|uniref:uncharacterized protein n=1 Tax=Palaemon carinicauda TaxID=392227 RepID=UPI0035B6282B